MFDAPRVHNKHHGTAPADAVYIGRPSEWGNEFIVGIHGQRGECVVLHREMVENNPELKAKIRRKLKGKHLVCFCKPRACHGDTLFEIANEPGEDDW